MSAMNGAPSSIREWSERYLAAYPLLPEGEGSLRLRLGGYGIMVRSNSQALLAKLGRYFRDFLDQAATLNPGPDPDATIIALETPPLDPETYGLAFTVKEPDPGKERIKEESIDYPDGRLVRKRLTGTAFFFGQGRNLAVGPCLSNDNQVVNFINNRFIEWTLDAGCLLFHAAGVSRAGKGLALSGFSGAGKSTLALHIMNLGEDFVSNDRLMVKKVDRALTMYGLAKMPRVNPGTVLNNPSLAGVIAAEDKARFAALPPDELWRLEHKYDAFIDECYGPGRFKLTAAMAGLVVLNWKRAGQGAPASLKAERVDVNARRDLLPAFMKPAGLFYEASETEPPDFSEQAYLDLLAGCPVYEITGSIDFETAAEICHGLL